MAPWGAGAREIRVGPGALMTTFFISAVVHVFRATVQLRNHRRHIGALTDQSFIEGSEP